LATILGIMVKSLEEFINEINADLSQFGNKYQTTTLPWYRGQSNEDWGLLPGIFRKGDSEYERELIRDFKLHANLKFQRQTESNFEILFLMQHYGIPTRLLDWTESYLFALYFAVYKFENRSNSAVWIMNPWDLNRVVLPKLAGFREGDRTIPISSDKRINCYALDIENLKRKVDPIHPIAIRPIRSSDRIAAQKGMFTIHGIKRIGLDEIVNEYNQKQQKKIPLRKVIIDGGSKLTILKQLFAAGISHSILFPELEGYAQEIAFRYSREFTEFDDSHSFFGFK
jgi:hypothetical protein